MISPVRVLKLMYWNANSIRNKIIEFYDFLSSNDIHIACVSETHLKPEHNLHSHPDYLMYRLDRIERDCGGVAIVLRRGIVHRLLPDLNMKLLETIGIEITLHDNSKIRFYSTYLPGSSRASMVRQHFINDLKLITSRNRTASYFICGDLNARHRHFNCLTSNTAGRLLYDEYINNDFVIAFPSTPTYIPEDPNRNPSTLDIMITNSLLQYSDLTCEYLVSDHNAVYTDIQLSSPSILNNNRLVRSFDKANWARYQRVVLRNLNLSDTQIDSITTTEQIDDLVESLTKAMSEAQNAAVPLVQPSEYRIKLTPFLRFLIIMRRHFRREWTRSHNPLVKTTVNALTTQIRNGIQQIRNDNWSRRLHDLPQDDNKKSLWKLAKFLKNRNRAIPALRENDRILLTSEEKSEALASKFAEYHQNPLASHDPLFTDSVERSVSNYLSDRSNIDPGYPTIEETTSYIRQLKRSKAPGMDRIHNTLIKNLPPQAIFYLNFIICCCLKLSYFPTKWKTASVIPIRKPGKDASQSASYRPISLLSSLSKILEKVILCRMNTHTDLKNILPSAQHGFRQFYSTSTQLHRVTEKLRWNLRRKRTTGIVLFDIEKAFDRIWHSGLIFKMIRDQYPKYIVHIIASFLCQRKFHVSINAKTSTERHIPFGVPQGSVLSPSLYNIYTSDIPSPPDCMTALYADDTALISALNRWQNTNEALSNAAHEFFTYYEKWKINLNSGKTQALLVTRRRTREVPQAPFQLNNDEIEWEHQAKYLGLIIDKTMTMKHHIDYVIGKTQNAVKLLYPLLHRKSKLSVDNKILLFKTALRPIYTYACPLYSSIAKTHLLKVQRLQNKILKMILDLPWHTSTTLLHDENDIELVNVFTSRLEEKFNSKLIFLEGETN